MAAVSQNLIPVPNKNPISLLNYNHCSHIFSSTFAKCNVRYSHFTSMVVVNNIYCTHVKLMLMSSCINISHFALMLQKHGQHDKSLFLICTNIKNSSGSKQLLFLISKNFNKSSSVTQQVQIIC